MYDFLYHARVIRSALIGRVAGSLLLLIVAFGCVRQFASNDDNDVLTHLLGEYRSQAATGIPGFSVVDRVARAYRSREEESDMVAFLSSHVQRFATDPNNGTYLIYIGDHYREIGATEIAREYYLRSLTRYPKLVREDADTHVAALNRLLAVTGNAQERIGYYSQLLERFEDYVDPGRTYYYLAREYERAGLWDDAYDAYERFLAFPETDIPGEPGARREIATKLSFYESSRDWTWQELEALVASIKSALWSQNTAALLRHRARENFFTMSWEQQESDANSQIPSFDIGFFLRRSRVRYAEQLDLASNAHEAYLRTWGWSHRIPTWYLYFRRVDFPSDPEINGTWEWAGIYFGEAL